MPRRTDICKFRELFLLFPLTQGKQVKQQMLATCLTNFKTLISTVLPTVDASVVAGAARVVASLLDVAATATAARSGDNHKDKK